MKTIAELDTNAICLHSLLFRSVYTATSSTVLRVFVVSRGGDWWWPKKVEIAWCCMDFGWDWWWCLEFDDAVVGLKPRPRIGGIGGERRGEGGGWWTEKNGGALVRFAERKLKGWGVRVFRMSGLHGDRKTREKTRSSKGRGGRHVPGMWDS